MSFSASLSLMNLKRLSSSIIKYLYVNFKRGCYYCNVINDEKLVLKYFIKRVKVLNNFYKLS